MTFRVVNTSTVIRRSGVFRWRWSRWRRRMVREELVTVNRTNISPLGVMSRLGDEWHRAETKEQAR